MWLILPFVVSIRPKFQLEDFLVSLQAHNIRRVTQLHSFMKNKKEDLTKKQQVWEARFQKRSSDQARREHEDSLKFFQVKK